MSRDTDVDDSRCAPPAEHDPQTAGDTPCQLTDRTPYECSGLMREPVLVLSGFRDGCSDARGAVEKDRRFAVRDDHALDRQLRDEFERGE